jgi:putative transposase
MAQDQRGVASEADATDPDRIQFSPSILPPQSIETLLPILYPKGTSTGDFSEALAALLGKDAAWLPTSAIVHLKDGWRPTHPSSVLQSTGRRR